MIDPVVCYEVMHPPPRVLKDAGAIRGQPLGAVHNVQLMRLAAASAARAWGLGPGACSCLPKSFPVFGGRGGGAAGGGVLLTLLASFSERNFHILRLGFYPLPL